MLFTAQDQQTIRDAFGRAKPNSEYSNFTPPPWRAARPIRFTIYHSPAPRLSFLGKVRGA